MKKEGKIIVIFGTSGSGQDAVIEGLLKKGLRAIRVITTVTRGKRPGERNGRPYYFISEGRFREMIKKNKFIEWDEHYGAYYGCTYNELERVKKTGKIILWKTEMRGALAIKRKFPNVIVIMIKPPSIKVALERLKKRGDGGQVVGRRLVEIKSYMRAAKNKKFDFVVTNKEGGLDETVDRVKKIIEKNI